VVDAAAQRGWGTRAVATSPLPGPSGNVEFFVWLRRGPSSVDDGRIRAVVSAGPTSVPGERVSG
jgi:23S rRNA (cytidine1920-2'-O)/16S rRNA (cytidine1409-2'-O)-methyltransferase